VLFVGSSSIRLWSSAAAFPGCGIVNRGFGGAQISDVQHFYEAVVARYRPRAILFYAGDNDVWAGKSPGRVLEDFQEFVETVRRDQPDAPIYFLAIKPSPRRWHLWRDMEEANGLIRAWAGSQGNVVYVDVATPMLGADGRPRPELFAEDDLHLNEAGYEVWKSVLAGPLTPLCRTAATD
jgi:lysophospholipase L1-like esterase